MSLKWLERDSSESVSIECLYVLPQPLQLPVHPLDLSSYLLHVTGGIPSLNRPIKMNLRLSLSKRSLTKKFPS